MIKKALFALLATAAVVGCTKNEGFESYNSSDNVVNFSSQSIGTRTNDVGDEWISGDKIGIFSDGFDSDYSNVAYQAVSSDIKTDFSLVDDQDPILYPNVAESAGKTVDFYAYYPHDTNVGVDGLATIDVSEQSELGAIDFMTASATGNSYYLGKEYSDVVFNFSHKLSQLILNISVNENITSLEGLAATITGIETQGTYYTYGDSQIQGTLSGSLTNADEVELVVSVADDKKTATITAILHPATYSTAKISFTLDQTDAVYSVNFATTLTVGNAHTFNIALGNDITGFESGSTISEWGEGGSSTLYPATSDIIYNGTSYEIYTAAGLKAFADLVNGTENTTAFTSGDGFASFGAAYADINATLMNDIDLSSICSSGSDNSWTPIGDYSSSLAPLYSGIFDGGGYNIRGLYINSENNFQGLFGYVEGATIKDFGVVGGSVKGVDYVGAIVGSADDSSITGCYNTGDVEGSGDYVGGIAGQASASTITSCYSVGEVSGSGSYVGGVVGYNKNSSEITYCYYNTDVAGAIGAVSGVDSETVKGLSTSEMTDGTLYGYLNEGLADTWTDVSVGYPVLSK